MDVVEAWAAHHVAALRREVRGGEDETVLAQQVADPDDNRVHNVDVEDRYCYGSQSVFTDAERAARPTGEKVQCDEFPFARTVEGAGYNGRDFSFKFIGWQGQPGGQ
ncbi:hypothetical protein [Nonomuraea sp. NPDC049480]|uniref:hypothetical protein n=1 Tax=Nonomuraea sp. NPDC049480 TaxID=3364353 RepID=UPI0037A38AE8